MKFSQTALPGVMLIEPEPHRDERGFFARLYCPTEFANAGIEFAPTQVNMSRNTQSYTLRGLHYQAAPHGEAKLIRVTSGRIFEVVVDLRKGTASYLRWISLELDAASATAIFIPEGCAHGLLTLQPDTDIIYQMGRDYEPGKAKGLRWNDPVLGIPWPGSPAQVSPQDQAWPLLS